MACATLKRPANDCDVLASSRSAKRPRRGAPPSSARSSPLGASRAAPKRRHTWHLDDPDGTYPKIRRCDPTDQPSPFPGVPLKTSEEIAADVRDELRRLQRRRQLVGLDSDGCEGYYYYHPSEATTPPGFGNLAGSSPPARKEQPLFTFGQVGLICERAMRERDGEIRAEYDRVLREKLSEQYDAFVKFTHDQIRKRFEGGVAPSYLS